MMVISSGQIMYCIERRLAPTTSICTNLVILN